MLFLLGFALKIGGHGPPGPPVAWAIKVPTHSDVAITFRMPWPKRVWFVSEYVESNSKNPLETTQVALVVLCKYPTVLCGNKKGCSFTCFTWNAMSGRVAIAWAEYIIWIPRADWPVGQFGRMPEEKKFVRAWRHLHFWVFLPTDLHFLQFVGRFGQIVPGSKNIASPPLLNTRSS